MSGSLAVTEMNGITSFVDRSMRTKADAEPVAARMDALRKLLSASVSYARELDRLIPIEARTIIDISYLSGEPTRDMPRGVSITLGKMNGMTGEEKEGLYREVCETRERLITVINRRFKEYSKRCDTEWAQDQFDGLVAKLSETGRADLNDVTNIGLDDRTFDALKNRCKDSLLKAGAVGIGEGVYVDPTKSHAARGALLDAMQIRVGSIKNDVSSLASNAVWRNELSVRFPEIVALWRYWSHGGEGFDKLRTEFLSAASCR